MHTALHRHYRHRRAVALARAGRAFAVLTAVDGPDRTDSADCPSSLTLRGVQPQVLYKSDQMLTEGVPRVSRCR
ncbi:hypothetical protein FHR83_006520 [Actinoplanes campanulatus]|uniref:Uncharacterized protein n=1 Tax=Actinoplanes campanulatus TaxID=113559 RepID=A0A7W5AM50_9ACTN|nr:hypothetical protein [Actinoplanes campanulatus]GGN36873.1 hypothetical protein GCM10010109_62250 [Actinoplanes campanulatus]GID42652.1 hypothetical protein Aca09nite_91580 [Actinoplanes campanulatus]